MVISQQALDPKEPPMAETRSYRQVQLDKAEKQAGVHNQEASKLKPPQTLDETHNRGIDKVVIPDDLTMATNIRAYREWPGECESHDE